MVGPKSDGIGHVISVTLAIAAAQEAPAAADTLVRILGADRPWVESGTGTAETFSSTNDVGNTGKTQE